jgi:hypothetical protein
MKSPNNGKWVYCYLPSINEKLQIRGETINYWLVEHERKLVVKSACTMSPTTKERAVRNPR